MSKDGEVDASHYIDSSAKKVFGFDHLKQTCTDETRDLTDGELDASVEEYRYEPQRRQAELRFAVPTFAPCTWPLQS